MTDYETKLFTALDAMQEGETKELKFESEGQKRRFIGALRKYTARDLFSGIVLNTEETKIKRKQLSLVVLAYLDKLMPGQKITLPNFANGEKLRRIVGYVELYCSTWPEAGVEFVSERVIRKVDFDYNGQFADSAKERLFADLMKRLDPPPKKKEEKKRMSHVSMQKITGLYSHWYSSYDKKKYTGINKVHLANADHKVLCGFESKHKPTSTREIDTEYFSLGVKSGVLCEKCAQVAIKLKIKL